MWHIEKAGLDGAGIDRVGFNGVGFDSPDRFGYGFAFLWAIRLWE